MRRSRHIALLAAVAMVPALSGCVAAVAPIIAGGLVGRKVAENPEPAPEPVRTPVVEVAAKPGVPSPDAGTAPAVSASSVPSAPATTPAAVLNREPELVAAPAPAVPSASARELPAAMVEAAPQVPPVPAVAPPRASFALRTEEDAVVPEPGSFAAFGRFATVRAAPPLAGKPRQSALIDPASLAALPRTGSCTSQRPAVAIDLDPGDRTFNLDDPPLPADGLARMLADLRVGGLSILWLSSLPSEKEPQLRTILQATGLDPQRGDRLLLKRKEKDRKTTRLRDAAGEWCVVAIAGDRRGDFEEAYDFLKDPDGPIARTLDSNLGNGWFLTPLPIQ